MRYIVLNINSSFLAKFRFPAREYMRRCNALVRSPQSMFYTDEFPIMYEDQSLLEAGDRLQMS